VGFYSAFMVAKEVKVISRAYNSENAFCWTSDGANGYTIEPAAKEGHGTDIIMTLKDDTEEENTSVANAEDEDFDFDFNDIR